MIDMESDFLSNGRKFYSNRCGFYLQSNNFLSQKHTDKRLKAYFCIKLVFFCYRMINNKLTGMGVALITPLKQMNQ